MQKVTKPDKIISEVCLHQMTIHRHPTLSFILLMENFKSCVRLYHVMVRPKPDHAFFSIAIYQK